MSNFISARNKAYTAVNSAMIEFGAHCAPNLTWSHFKQFYGTYNDNPKLSPLMRESTLNIMGKFSIINK